MANSVLKADVVKCLNKKKFQNPRGVWSQNSTLVLRFSDACLMLTMAKCSRSSPNSFLIFLNRLTTARHGPHHCWNTSTTDRPERHRGYNTEQWTEGIMLSGCTACPRWVKLYVILFIYLSYMISQSTIITSYYIYY